VALQGNLDPNILFAPPKVIEHEVQQTLAAFGHGTGHVFNLGHGISQFTHPDHAKTMIDAVHHYSKAYHQS
jgi:uroporphyrinogen decarboxylase